ncbi:acyl-CoA dehydrogenase family protein [Nocardioides sp. NPDC051685]|uniref:acyl-CoA dehydrogenase family protein n=1 Tax=Nocardioides sp. NPDC051685 TaxID=3364334 RepID=UPI0037A5758B
MELAKRPGYDADHADFAQSVRRFLADHVVGQLDGWRAGGGLDRGVFAAAGEQGFLGTTVPEDLGGAGLDDPRFAAVLVEEIAATGAAGLALVAARHVGVVMPALAAVGAPQVAGMVAGELIGCVAALSAEGRANGVPGAGVADVFVLVDTDRPDRFVVAGRDELDVVPGRMLGGAEGAVADVVVPSALRDRPRHDAPGLLAALDLWGAVVSVGAARAAFDLTVDYVQERVVFGRKLATFENTRFRLAEVGAELTAARGLVDSALAELAGGSISAALAAAVRIVAASVHDHAVDQGLQLHGGYGYMREYPIAHAFGDARFVRVASATSEPRAVLAAALGL